MRIMIAAAVLLAAGFAQAADYDVSQKENAFSVKALRIKPGDSINFRNDDPHFHNVFSLSDAQSFDLGSYPKGQTRKVTFAKEGTVEVECAIHPDMKLKVEVAK
jgi:plastocyanin